MGASIPPLSCPPACSLPQGHLRRQRDTPRTTTYLSFPRLGCVAGHWPSCHLRTSILNSLFLPLSSPPACPCSPGAPPAALAVPRVAWRGPAGLRPAHPVPPIATAAWRSPPPPPPASPASPPTTPASSPRTPLIPNRLPPCPRTSPARYREGGPCCRPPCLSFLFRRMGGWCWVQHKGPVQR